MKAILLSLIDRYINYQKNLTGGRLIGAGVTLLGGGVAAKLIQYFSMETSIHTEYGNIGAVLKASPPEWYIIIPALFLIGFGIYLYVKKATVYQLTPVEIQSLAKASVSNLRGYLLESSKGTVGDGHFSDLRELFLQSSSDKSIWCEQVVDRLKGVRSFFEQAGRSNPDMKLAIGGVAHVPILATIGYYLTNRCKAIFFCWHRDNKAWVNTEDQTDTGKHFRVERIGSTDNAQSVGVIVQCSIPINSNEFVQHTGSEACYLLTLDEVSIGNLFSAHEQQRLCREFGELYNHTIRPQHPRISRLDVTISAQGSFVMRLGAEFNQNHMPEEVRVWHFENKSYPWSMSIFPHRKNSPISMKWHKNPTLAVG